MKTIANCRTCNTLLVGESLRQIGGNYYCEPHYQIVMERPINQQMKQIDKKLNRLLTPFENLIDTDLSNWGLVETTELNNTLQT